MAIEKTKKTTDIPQVNGCIFCGWDVRNHGLTYSESEGYHYYHEPTDAVRKERFLLRRANGVAFLPFYPSRRIK